MYGPMIMRDAGSTGGGSGASTTPCRRVVLGSGDAYLAELDTDTIDTSDVDVMITEYFVDGNRFGETKNGGNFSYTPTTYTVESDLGRIVETYLTKEEVKLGFGLLTVDSSILSPLMATSRVSTSTAGRTVIKVGGLKNDSGKSYFVGFKHPNKKKGNIYVMIIGKNNGELAFNFNPDSETIINPTFTGQSMDDDGTKIIIVFDRPTASS